MAEPTIVETRTASLETMAVTIQSLHVNGKQMTLAVFRQLPRVDFCPARHTAWGTVRYKFDNASRWLVFEHHGRLFRDSVGLSVYQSMQWERQKEVMDYVESANLPQLFIAV